MTSEEIRAVCALGHVEMGFHRGKRSFISNLSRKETSYELTEGQRAYLWTVAYYFRRQLPPSVAALAERERPAAEAFQAQRRATREAAKAECAPREQDPPAPPEPAPKFEYPSLFD